MAMGTILIKTINVMIEVMMVVSLVIKTLCLHEYSPPSSYSGVDDGNGHDIDKDDKCDDRGDDGGVTCIPNSLPAQLLNPLLANSPQRYFASFSLF